MKNTLMSLLWVIAWMLAGAVCIVGFGCGTAVVGPAPVVVDNTEIQTVYPTVQIQVWGGPYGTGVIIGWDGCTAHVLSVAHLFIDHEDPRVIVRAFEPAPYEFDTHPVWRDVEADLVILEGQPPGEAQVFTALLLPRSARVERLQDVVAVGTWPAQDWLVASAGSIAQAHDPSLVQVNGWFGASGGPVYVQHGGLWKVWAVLSNLSYTHNGKLDAIVTGLIHVAPLHNGILP